MLPTAELDVQVIEDERRPFPSDKQPVAVICVNYNMPERSDALASHLFEWSQWPFDLFLVDNGSDLLPPAKWTSVRLDKNVQTTGGWLAGVEASRLTGIDYLGYLFLITSAEFTDISEDILTPMAVFLNQNPNAVGIHPALTTDSTTRWSHMKSRGGVAPRQVPMIDNICALYRRSWWDGVGGFDSRFVYGWGPDLELGYIARQQARSLWIDEHTWVRKITNIGYKMNRMRMSAEDRVLNASSNMDRVMTLKYGSGWKKLMYTEEMNA